MRRHGPRGCLEEKPTHQSIRLGGRYISLAKLHIATGFDHGYLSYVFSGKRSPSTPNARIIAQHLQMSLDEMLMAIDVRVSELAAKSDRSMDVARQHVQTRDQTDS